MAVLVITACGEDGLGPASGQGQDPVVVDVPIAYVKRPVPANAQGQVVTTDARRLLQNFEIGADLIIRERAAPSAQEINITGELTQGEYDVRDVSVSWDGERLVFAMRGPFIENADPEDQPTWNIWEYDRITDQLRRVIASNLTAELGHDLSPHYLPDGRIVFTSTRQRESKALLLDEGKPQFDALDENLQEPAFVLHVMNDDGSDIRQISFNQSHDREPSVLDNGQVVFSRWDRYGSRNEISLYRMNPDGSGLEMLYGKNSRNTGPDGIDVHFLRPRQMPDGRILAL
ncbi:MAG: PD40 domain-containing protein, partial [Gammaproteobacteria bacterium]|nr:PD40 domain-containing protein [Gammaproteobacteria bacterium]